MNCVHFRKATNSEHVQNQIYSIQTNAENTKHTGTHQHYFLLEFLTYLYLINHNAWAINGEKLSFAENN